MILKSDAPPAASPPGGDDNVYAPPKAALSEGNALFPSAAPWLFGILMIPFGIATGYASVTLGSLLEKGGITGGEVSRLATLGTLPHWLKFLWSPMVDVTLSPKRWYIISTILTAIAVAMLGAFPANESGLWGIRWFVFLAGLTTTVTGMATEILMAHGTADDRRGRTGGWFQAGNVGGSAIGGGLGLLIATRVPQYWMASSIIAAGCALCCLALLGLPSPRAERRTAPLLDLMKERLLDAWHLTKVPRGLLALILCSVPLGLCASGSMWSAIASEWKTDSDTVAVVTGILGGIVSTAGCLSGGWCCDRWHRQKCYVVFGLIVSVMGVAMGLLPRTREVFIGITLCLSFATGMSWAAYAAFVLEATGRTGAATKFSAFASLANFPIWYMGYVNGWTKDWWGTTPMLIIEAVLGVIGAAVFLTAARKLLSRRGTAGIAAETGAAA